MKEKTENREKSIIPKADSLKESIKVKKFYPISARKRKGRITNYQYRKQRMGHHNKSYRYLQG